MQQLKDRTRFLIVQKPNKGGFTKNYGGITSKIRIGVIPAAGPGERMGYLGQILPKCLSPLYDRPIIHHVTEHMRQVGVRQVYVVVNYQKDKVIEYFKSVGEKINANVDFVHQKKLLGIADAVALTEEVVDEPFMVILGDDCTFTESLRNLLDLFFKRDAAVVEGIVKEKNREVLKTTCCLKLDRNKRITKIMEKPDVQISNLRGCGVYVFNDEIFEYIKKTPLSPIRNEIEITHTINLVAEDGKAYGEFIDGINVNVNTYDDLLLASTLMKKFKEGILFSSP